MNEKNNDHDHYLNEKYWYTAETKLGKLYIGIYCTLLDSVSGEENLPDLIQKAVVLNKSNEVICHIEDWLENGLVLQPTTIIPQTQFSFTIQSKDNNKNLGQHQVILSMQDIDIGKISEPTIEILNNIDIRASCVPVKFVLSEFAIEKGQYDQIEDGRILLIPDSFDSEWRIKLFKIGQKSMYRTGILNRDARTLVISNLVPDTMDYTYNISHFEHQDNDFHNLTITIRDAIPISLDRLLGWTGDNTHLLDYSLRHYKAEIRNQTDIIATGQIISVADGYGIDISM